MLELFLQIIFGLCCCLVFFRNIFHALFTLLLIFFFFSILIFFFVDFMGLLILLIYASGLAILFLFVSLTIKSHLEDNSVADNWVFKIVVAIAFVKTISLFATFNPSYFLTCTVNSFDVTFFLNNIQLLGYYIFIKFSALLIYIVLILFLVLIGALACVKTL